MEEIEEILPYIKLPIFGVKNSGKTSLTMRFGKILFDNEEHTYDRYDSNKNNIIYF